VGELDLADRAQDHPGAGVAHDPCLREPCRVETNSDGSTKRIEIASRSGPMYSTTSCVVPT
jgi:hypothetical protein